MDKDAAALFFAMLTVLANLFVVAAIVGALIVKLAPASATADRVLDARDMLSPAALWVAAIVAGVTMGGSLYLSEGLGYPPCHLCWAQRAFMYPLSLILLVAAITRYRWTHRIVLPLTIIGGSISIYHYQLERFPEQTKLSCSVSVPCTTVWIWKFHYISIPFMALSSFAAITVLVLTARSAAHVHDPELDVDDAGSREGVLA